MNHLYVLGVVDLSSEVLLHECEEGLCSEQTVAACLVHGPDALDLQCIRQRAQTSVHALHCGHHILRSVRWWDGGDGVEVRRRAGGESGWRERKGNRGKGIN